MPSSSDSGSGAATVPPYPFYPAAVNWAAALPATPVSALLETTCARFADRPALTCLGKTWTWAAIGLAVNRLAAGLQKEGVVKGTRVGLFLPNGPYFLIAYYAVLKAGGTVVNFNPLYAPREIRHQIEDSGTEMMITADLAALYNCLGPMLDTTCLRRIVVCSFARSLPFPKNILFPILKRKDIAAVPQDARHPRFETLIAAAGVPEPVAIDPQRDVAVLQYTGGTTGTPKGAMLTHANIVANVEQAVLWFHKAREGEEKMLGVLPFFHVFAMTAVMNLAVRCGFEIIALPRFHLDEALSLISRRRPEYFPAVPAIYNAVNTHPHRDRYDLTSLKYCISGGAPLPVEVKKEFEQNTGCVVVEGYGLSEASPVVCVNPIEEENKPGSIGLPVPGTIVELIDPATGEPAASGEPGELCVRGPQVMAGYWNRPEESAAVLKDGRLHTGDIARADPDGYLYIIDRIKDLIITNGYNVYPRNVEEAIHMHPAVAECIVAGIPDKARGEAVKAWVRPRAGMSLTGEELKIFLRDKISKMEMPRQIEIRTEPLPKTMIGKLSRKDILAQEKDKTQTP